MSIENNFYVQKTVYYNEVGIKDDNLYCLVCEGSETEIPDLTFDDIKRLHDLLGKMIEKEKDYQKMLDILSKNE